MKTIKMIINENSITNSEVIIPKIIIFISKQSIAYWASLG